MPDVAGEPVPSRTGHQKIDLRFGMLLKPRESLRRPPLPRADARQIARGGLNAVDGEVDDVKRQPDLKKILPLGSGL